MVKLWQDLFKQYLWIFYVFKIFNLIVLSYRLHEGHSTELYHHRRTTYQPGATVWTYELRLYGGEQFDIQVKFLTIFWQSNGKFPEGQVITPFLIKHIKTYEYA